jgi:uncharacterized lipoprotein YmbA
MKRRFSFLVAATLAAGLLAGCGSLFSAKKDPSKFYVLTAVPTDAAPATPPLPGVALSVFSPEFPQYLDRPQLVTRIGANQRQINEFQRWSEPVQSGFARVLTEDLGTLAGTSKVAMFPLVRVFDHEFEVYTQVYQFDGALGGNATLRVRWRITGSNGKPNYVVRDSSYMAPVQSEGDPYAGYVATLSHLIGEMAREIVAALPEARAAETQAATDKALAGDDKAKADAAAAASAATATPPPNP